MRRTRTRMFTTILCFSSCLPTSFNYRIQSSKRNPSSLSYFNYSSAIRQYKPFSLNNKTPLNLENDSFLRNFKENQESNPVQILTESGDCNKKQFWDVVGLLRKSSRASEILKVFETWKSVDKSRINGENYRKIILILIDEGLIEQAVALLQDMKNNNLTLSLEIYNSIIHSFAKNGRFSDAKFYLKEMEEKLDVKPDTETYDGLIEAYGDYKMYDEMNRCIREMKSKGLQSDYVTHNLLIREFARAGLLKKMESLYRSLLDRGMKLQSSTLGAMVEAYAKFKILDKMEKMGNRYMKSRTNLEPNLVRKLAIVYIENRMFSRLEDLSRDLFSRNGGTDLVWCLRLLCHACLMSKKGIYSVFEEMESHDFPWNPTVVNILGLAYLKMKEFKKLESLLLGLASRRVTPDIITMGILFDACLVGFDGTGVKRKWKESGFFDNDVEMSTDSLVLVAFGKGYFLKSFEAVHVSREIGGEIEGVCTYGRLINSIRIRAKAG